jgi:hypothetical protein
MRKMSLAMVAAIAAASSVTPALAQIADPRYAPPLYDYYPAAGINVAAPYSDFPAATGGGSTATMTESSEMMT